MSLAASVNCSIRLFCSDCAQRVFRVLESWHGISLKADTSIKKEITMPVLPSGRRIEFSLDRFLAMLDRIEPEVVYQIVEALEQPEDLLPVTDVVGFDPSGTIPVFAGYVASDWERHAQDWSVEDCMALSFHLRSEISVGARAEAIATLKELVGRRDQPPTEAEAAEVADGALMAA
jgi:hypothetical protein